MGDRVRDASTGGGFKARAPTADHRWLVEVDGRNWGLSE